jgi:hypothetical protein
MAVVTVVGEGGVQVLVEFAGGPRSGKRLLAIATTDLEGKPIPPSGFGSGQLPDDPADAPETAESGSYVREGVTPDGEAYAYVWRTSAPPTEEPPTAPMPDLATRIRRAYARRASSDLELDEGLNRPVMPRRKTTDGGEA